jgi:hypothetical protein
VAAIVRQAVTRGEIRDGTDVDVVITRWSPRPTTACCSLTPLDDAALINLLETHMAGLRAIGCAAIDGAAIDAHTVAAARSTNGGPRRRRSGSTGCSPRYATYHPPTRQQSKPAPVPRRRSTITCGRLTLSSPTPGHAWRPRVRLDGGDLCADLDQLGRRHTRLGSDVQCPDAVAIDEVDNDSRG